MKKKKSKGIISLQQQKDLIQLEHLGNLCLQALYKYYILYRKLYNGGSEALKRQLEKHDSIYAKRLDQFQNMANEEENNITPDNIFDLGD